MNSLEFKNTICRICLDENVALDWSWALSEYSDVTYKDCYYKYTQLQPLDADPFSSMLCQNCLNNLENIHALIVKALDSHNFLLEVNCMNSEKEDSLIMEDDLYSSTDFETVIVEKPEIEEEFECESYDEVSTITEGELKKTTHFEEIQFHEISDIEDEETKCDFDQALQINTKDKVPKSLKALRRQPRNVNSNKNKSNEAYDCYDGNNCKKTKRSSYNRHKKEQDKKLENKLSNTKNSISKTKSKVDVTPCMCSFCSKILHNKYGLQKHEKTHIANRERKAPCPICGVKFLQESYVKIHMQIHNENRIKKHKCEFCDKAFFEKGSLNVHRRIHLGQMIPCTLCSKEFFRKVDLDIHMNSHSANVINVEIKKRSRYLVRCKYCNKNIMSTSFKSHMAIHLNEPLMKCSICNKEFFRRDSCTEHLKNIHKKTTPQEYNEFIILYKKNRLSHLYLEQTAELQVNED